MHFLSDLVLVAGVVIVGVPTFASRRDAVPRTEAAAMVRFVNNTTDTVTLDANGTALFEDIAPGTLTRYAQLADSATTFTLMIRDQPGEPATATEKLDGGASYTITARKGMEGKARLTVTREEQPGVHPTPW